VEEIIICVKITYVGQLGRDCVTGHVIYLSHGAISHGIFIY
jgi:hypothetical protein